MRTQIQRLAIAASLALASAAASSAFAAGNPAVGGAAMDAQKTIVENASAATDLSTLVTADLPPLASTTHTLPSFSSTVSSSPCTVFNVLWPPWLRAAAASWLEGWVPGTT